MRVCLLSYRGNPFAGGQGVYVHYLSRELVRLGHEVDVFAGPPYPVVVDEVGLHRVKSLNLYEMNGRHPFRFPDLLHPLNIYEVVAVKAGLFPEPFTFSIRAYGRLRRDWGDRRYDVIHDNQSLGYGLLPMRGLGVPVVATLHHPIPIDRNAEIAQTKSALARLRLLRWYSFTVMQGIVARRLDRVITVSESSAAAAMRFFRIPEQRLRVVHNGVDCDVFVPCENAQRPPNSIIVTTSSDMAVKGLRYLLEAIAILRARMPVCLTVVGNDDPDSGGPRLAHRYGVEDAVRFTGRVETASLAGHYARAAVAVVPSLFEGFGLPAAEAMSCGLPVVASTGGALPEVVGRNGECGLLVPPGDARALASALERLLSDESLRRRMGMAGRRRVLENFSWREAARRTVAVYEEARRC